VPEIPVLSGARALRADGRMLRRIVSTLFLVALFAAPGDAIYVEEQQYLQVPDAAHPLDELLPQKGVESTGGKGLLQVNSAYLKRKHNINFETRQVEIIRYVSLPPPDAEPGSQDTTPMWQSYYTELNSYSVDMSDLALRRLWLNQFIGKEDASQAGGPGMLDIVLPVNVPDWMRRIGVDKPRLRINGSYKLVVEGTRLSGNGVPGGGDTWFPSLHMDQQPAFSVKGSIGRLINIEINSEEGFGTNLKEQLKITYKGEGDELEDDIIQEIEAGNTSLALTGTSLTGYTESHKGLFGLKMRMKFGGLEVTTIASQEGGSQERQTLGVGTVLSDAIREDRDIDLHRHFWLTLQDRAEYGSVSNWQAGTQRYLNNGQGRRPVRVWSLLTGTDKPSVTDTATACPYNIDGAPIPTRCERGRWELLNEGTDFYYDERMRMLTVTSGNRNMSIAVRWQGDLVGGSSSDLSHLVLIHSRSAVGVPELDDLMWRNVYAISRISKEDKESFRVRMVRNSDSLDRDQNDTATFIRKLGMEKVDKPNQINIDDQTLFNLDQGYMVLPCLGGISPADDSANCLTPLKRVNKDTRIYDDPVDEIQNASTVHKFVISGKQRKSTFDVRETSHSVSGSSCIDIEKDTEKLVRNGSEVLVRNVDYEVLYETGQITLLSPRAKDPNAKIDISYECNPPFQIQDKILLGTRLEYKLDGISDESLLGATLLYKSQSTTSERPELGREPFNQFLWGFNARLAGTPKWMTSLANLAPFVQTEAPSKANFEFEIAQSRYNPNTKESAYLDNFEGSENILSMPMTIYSWFKSSPPDFDDNGKPDETLDYRHQGKFIWHSSRKDPYSRIYGSTGNAYTNSREQTLLQMTLAPNDNLEGRSWGGVMRALSPGLFNQSRKRTLEVVVYGREGTLSVDMGQISEDISIQGLNNAKPNGTLQSEIDVGRDITNKFDAGLDGKLGAAETGVVWECKPNCYAIPVSSSSQDKGGDDYHEPLGATEEAASVNGTEGNNKGTGGYTFDTEDLDRSGVLDVKNTFLRYVMPLDSACNTRYHCEELQSGWRKYQIPLYGSGFRIGANAGESETQILSNVKIIRAWVGHLPSRASRAQVLLARLNIVGNTWEEGDRSRAFETDADRFATGDLSDSSAIRVPPAVTDSNRLKVTVINKQEESRYLPSPNTPTETDTRTDEPLPERSLVLRYENLHRGEVVGATRLLGSDPKDLTLYDRIRLEIHPDSNSVEGPDPALFKPDQNRISLGLRLGKDQGNRDSKDYYEIRIHMDTAGIYDAKHVALWERNSFDIRMSDLTNLKNDDFYRAFNGRPVSRQAWHSGRQDSSLTLSVVGNPTLSRIDWMRLVIYVDSGAAVTSQSGEIWVNDLRLQGVDHSLGSSMRTEMQMDFSDFVSVSGKLTYRNGGFTTMSETKATPANSQSTVDYNATASLYANKFFPDQWGVSLPFSLQYHGSVSRPFTQPSSDLTLQGTDFMDFVRDIADDHLTIQGYGDSISDVDNRYSRVYQTTVFEDRFTTSYKKEHRSANRLTQIFLERPDMEYSYSSSKRTEFYTANRSRSYHTVLRYSLSPFENKPYKPLGATEKLKYMPAFLSGMEFTPYPDKLNFTVGDLSFNRTETDNKPRNAQDRPLNLPPTYQVELTHGMDLEWRLLTFLNFGYRLAVDRDFDNERECFDESFFGQEEDACNGGVMAHKLIFDWDGPDRNSRHLGDEYGILYRERNRTESFHTDFNPAVFSWLTMGANFNSGFRQTRDDSVPDRYTNVTITPEHFEANADHDIKLNASLSLPALLGPSGDGKGLMGSFRKRMEDWRLRNFDFSYSVGHKYNNEEFTYDYLRQQASTGSYYAYQLGWVYDNPANLIGTLFDGEPDPKWMDFLMPPDPSLKTNSRFSHGVSRSFDAGTGFTVPWVDLGMSFNLKYTKEYTLFRAMTASDTSVVWPDITVTGTFNDFANKIPFLRKTFRSMTSTTTFNLRKEDKHALFSSSPETKKIAYKLDPLMRLAATTNKDVRGELSFKGGLENALDYEKTPRAYKLPYRFYTDTTQTPYDRDGKKKTKRDAFNVGGDATISYDVETQKGLQFWRYYIKLENNLRLKITGSANYMWTERTLPNQSPRKDQNILTLTTRPEVSYNFTNNVDAMFFTQYKYDKLWHTPREESTHELTVHGEFTMRF
jgi:hypothetical protein